MTDYEQKLRLYKTAYTQLQHSFKNNLNVIRQMQDQNSDLQRHLQEVSLKYELQLEKTLIQKQQKNRKNLEQQELEFAREHDLMKKEYESFISSLSENQEKKNQQLITALTKKHKRQIQNIRTLMSKELQANQLAIRKSQSRCKSLEESLTSTEHKLNTLNVKVISMESELQRLHKERQQTETLYSSKEQQLESIKQYSTSWEGTLKQRIKELQEQKSLVEEEMAEVRFAQRQKLKKLKDEHTKKLTLLEENHAQRLNETLHQSKEIKFKYQSIKQENTEFKTQTQYAKRELLQTKKLLQEQRFRFTSAQDSILTVKQKEFQIKSMTQEIRRLQNELKGLQEDKSLQKQQTQKINYQRENAQKALQRLKTQLLNKNRQCDEYKKQLDKVKYKNKVNSYQPQTLEQVMNMQAKGLARYEQKDAVKGGEVDYSKCFSDDMGGEDFKFLNSQIQSFPQKAPYGQNEYMQQSESQQPMENQHNQQNSTKISHLMKRVGELQVENQEYASTIKLIKQEMERTASTINDRLSLKDQEIRLGKNENILLREKLNDKEEQLMRVKDNLRQLKEQLQKASTTKQSAQQLAQLRQQKQQLQQENKKLLSQVQRLKESVADAVRERQILEEIADQLRAQVNFYKDQFEYIQQERASQFTSSNLNEQQRSSYHHKNASNSYERDYTNNNTSNQHSQFNQSNQLYQGESSNIRGATNMRNNNKPHNNHRVSPQNHNRLSSQNPSNLQPYQNRPNSRQKSPQNHKPKQQSSAKGPKRKLHQLIKQKNQLESEGALVMGRKANLQKRLQEQRVQHAGTKSQKQIYEKMQKRSKSKSKEKPTIQRLKDYELAKPSRQSSSIPVNRRSQRQQIAYNQQHQSANHQASHISQDVSQEVIEQSALMKRLEMMNRIKQSMGNDSLGEFDHLENVSMTYWDQQDHY